MTTDETKPEQVGDLPRFPMSPTDMKQWEMLEASLPALVNGQLSGEAHQHATRHMGHRVKHECWLCAQPNSLYDAMGCLSPPYPYANAKCHSCGIRLQYIVPFVSWPRPWFWGRPEDISLTAIQRAVENMYDLKFPQRPKKSS